MKKRALVGHQLFKAGPSDFSPLVVQNQHLCSRRSQSTRTQGSPRRKRGLSWPLKERNPEGNQGERNYVKGGRERMQHRVSAKKQGHPNVMSSKGGSNIPAS